MNEILFRASETAIVGSACCLVLSGLAALSWCALTMVATWVPALSWLWIQSFLFLTMWAPWLGFLLGCLYVWSRW